MNERVIEVRNLNFFYPDGNAALKNVSFSVSKGEDLAIIGPNGAGKSTLLLHLNGILRGEGQVNILDQELSKSNIKIIRRKVGIVFQDPNDQLFMPTVFEDIAFGLLNLGLERKDVEGRVDQVLRDLGLEALAEKSPLNLSYGEKKKVSLATILVLEPDILVFDEPTLGLDPGSKRNFIRLLKKLTMTKVLATHDIDLAWELCSKVVVMDNGIIVAEGTWKEILKNRRLLEDHGLEMPPSLLLKKLETRLPLSPL